MFITCANIFYGVFIYYKIKPFKKREVLLKTRLYEIIVEVALIFISLIAIYDYVGYQGYDSRMFLGWVVG